MSNIMDVNFNGTTAEMLKIISDYDEVTGFNGAYNIREDSKCAGRKSSENITIESKDDKPGINIRVKPFTVGETVYIPACVTHSDVDDLVYNDFYIGEGADVVIVAGCGVHNDGEEQARHNGIHRFFLEKGSKVLYKEKHIGTGKGTGLKKIDPVTDCVLGEDSYLEMDTVQLRGVDSTTRSTSAVLGKGAKIVVRERIMTDGDEQATTKFHVELNGEDSVDIVTTFALKQGYRLVWADRLGKVHEHVCQDPKGLHAGGDTVYTDTAINSICETYGDYIEDKRPYGYGFLQALNVCLGPTRWTAGTVDQTGTVDKGLTFYHTSAREALQSILKCGGELRITDATGTESRLVPFEGFISVPVSEVTYLDGAEVTPAAERAMAEIFQFLPDCLI